MAILESSHDVAENGTAGPTNKKRKRITKAERRRRRRKKAESIRRIEVEHNQQQCSSSKVLDSSPNNNRSLHTTVAKQSIDDNDTAATSTTLSKDDVCSSSTKGPPSPSSLVSSPEKCSSPPPQIESSTLFGNSTSISTLSNKVEFVYPKNDRKGGQWHERVNDRTIPYVHSKLRRSVGAKDDVKLEDSSEITNTTKDGKKTKLSMEEEDIDDILYPERKQKRIAETEKINLAKDEANAKLTRLIKTENLTQKIDDNKKDKQGGQAILFDKTKQKCIPSNLDDTSIKTEVVSDEQADITHKPDVEIQFKKKKSSLMDTVTERECGNDVLIENSDKKKENTKIKCEEVEAEGKKPDASHITKEERIRQEKIKEEKNRLISEVKTGRSKIKRQLSGLTVEDAVKDKVGSRPRCNSTDGELNLPQRGLCDEHMVLESHKWNVEKLYKRTDPLSSPRGFVNLGNTCFLNATLQCLAHLPTLCQCVAVMPSLYDKKKGHAMKKKTGSGQHVTSNLRVLFRKMYGLDGGNDPNQGPIAPREIVRSLSQLGGSNRGYKFRPGRQEDAHEFLVHLMDTMHDGELKAAGIDQKKTGWRNSIPIPRLEETTFVHRMFGGYLRSQVKCTHCQYSSNTYDPFLDLSLEISANNTKSISSSFAQFTRKETLDVANKWKCDGCKKRVCATKQLTCFRPPLSLCIQLKRFSFSAGGRAGFLHHKGGWGFGHFSGKGMGMARGGSKIQKPIEFPALLKLPLSDGRKCDYELTGIVIHVGGSATSGHYTAYVRRPSSKGDHRNHWYHMDDSYVKPVSEKTVLQQKDAYLLFYCRKEVKLEIPSPPITDAGEAQRMGEARARAKARVSSNLHIPGSGQNGKEIIKKVQNIDQDRLSSGDISPILGVAPQNKEIVGKSEIRSDANVINKVKCSDIEDAHQSKGSEGITPTGILNCENKENNIVFKKSERSSENKINESKEIRQEENTTINTDHEEGKQDNAKVGIKIKKEEAKRRKKVISFDMGQRGKVQVILNGPNKKKKKWKPNTSHSSKLLLGNVNAKGWDYEADAAVSDHMNKITKEADLVRRMELKDIVEKDKSRRRKMYTEKGDAELDKGKTKKVKVKSYTEPLQYLEPKDNPFQRIQHESMRKSKSGVKNYPSLKNKKSFQNNKKHFQKR